MSDASAVEQVKLGQIIAISGVATLGGFLFGFDSGVINGTVDGLQTAFNSDSVGTGFSVASMLLGSAVGALLAGRLADMFGRRTMLMVAAVFFIVSAWGSGIATNTTEFVLYRIIGGLAVGAASVMSPAYIAEIAPARIRGALTTIQQIAIVVGLTAAFLSNYLLAGSSGSALNEFWLGYETWRWMFWMELFPAFFFLFALFAIPESPRYLVVKDKADQAAKVLGRLFGPASADAKVAEIQTTLSADHKPRFADIFVNGGIRPIVWVGIGLATFQQLVGINVLFYYGATLWQAAGFSEEDALFQNLLMGSISIVGTILLLSFIDRIGRKPFLIFGSIGMAISLATMAWVFSTGTLDADGNLELAADLGQIALYAAVLYAFVFNMSWGPVMWVMLGEMFPNQIRGSSLAVAGLAQWTSNFAITMTFPIMLVSIGLAAAYGIYATFAAISVFFVVFLVRETKGKELEEMEG